MKKKKLYLDNCCFNRPFDDLTDYQMRLECEAILTIIGKCTEGVWEICGSDVLEAEIEKIINPIRKQQVLELYSFTSPHLEINDVILLRANELHALSIKPFDALHLASAEFDKADAFLTTDNKLINKVKKNMISKINIYNPVIWLMEVLYNDV
ncbi:MAG: PIN domain-containing protein [Candidatus Cloacimonetes bacterium]|nr:PIN domain-containing protein [Candidatus Cloacimonadota bacterium]